ncbi:MAG: hypothetical protein IKO36_04390 [Bacteroidaceae bacterium]|nr:hypothetical protein [Bacteroidaceae bacterium]
MKSWQLYDVIGNNVVAESNDYLELEIIRDDLIKKKTTILGLSVLIDYWEDDPANGNIKGQYIICNEKSEVFQRRRTKNSNK